MMGYHMDVHRVELAIEKGDSKAVEQKLLELYDRKVLWLGWVVDSGYVEPDTTFFNWDRSFIKDLLYLRDLGVRGHIVLHGSEDELVKYEVTQDAVREYESRTLFRKRPNRVYRKPSDIR